MIALSAFLLGIVAGLRTFTAPAALFLAKGGTAGYILAAIALGELVGDKLPKCPSRLNPLAVMARMISGGFVGWTLAGGRRADTLACAVLGILGALVGTFFGHAARSAGTKKIGAIPAALVEDAVAIGLAAGVVLVLQSYGRILPLH